MDGRGPCAYPGRMLRTRRRFVAIPALSLAMLLGGALSAQAASVQHSSKSPAEVSAYWTKERMRGATPRGVVRGGGQSQAGKGGGNSSWTRLAVPTPYSGVDRNNGKVFFTLDGVNYVCSGTSVAASAGISLVWTAGHCVHEGPGSYASNFMFAPVPEPTTLLMCGTVLLGAGIYRQRRRFGWLQRS